MDKVRPLALLFLWRLALNDSVGWYKELKPELGAPDRKILVSQGLISQYKQKREDRPAKNPPALRIELTEKGWQYLGENLTDPVNARTYAGADIFGQFLTHLARFLKNKSLSLADIFLSSPAPVNPEPVDPTPRVKAGLLAFIQEHHREGRAIRLAELRPILADLAREALDSALLRLQKERFLVLSSLGDDPSQVTQADKEAALWVARSPFHLIYLK
ncbi:MAG: hypothetical protein LBR11_06180 [Deltaproteobacteria bacterium]|jgi:hypothetical protein|nr:hypothetical protein [Deltaproteobacteria bacterium]